MSVDTLAGVKSTRLVGMADFQISHDPGVMLASQPLGSCLGVVIYDPVVRVAGLLHSLLPFSTMNPARAEKSPGMFLDTGLAAMIRQAGEFHATPDHLEVYVIGGAQILDESNNFNVGRRHYEALTALLAQLGLTIQAEDVGGRWNRSLQVDVETGEVRLKISGRPEWKTLCKR